MRLERTGATIAAGLFAGAVALGFGTGAAQADPVEWTDTATTTATLDMGEGPNVADLEDGAFEGEVDEDAGTITGDVVHEPYAFEIDTPLGTGDLDTQLTIGDIDLDWDQDDDTVDGTANIQLDLLSIFFAGDPDDPDDEGTELDLSAGGCSIVTSMALDGTYDGDQLTFTGDIEGIELDGTCGGLAGIIGGMLGDIGGDIVTVIGQAAEEPEEPEDPDEPEETTTTTEAPAEEAPPTGGGATPITKAPSYTG